MKKTITTSSQTLEDLLTDTEISDIKALKSNFGYGVSSEDKETITFYIQDPSSNSNTLYIEGHGVAATTSDSYAVLQDTDLKVKARLDSLDKISFIKGTGSEDIYIYADF